MKDKELKARLAMVRSGFWQLLPILLMLVASGAAYAQPPMAWWKNDGTVKELGLTADQSAHLETIFQASLVDLKREKTDLDTVEARLSHLIETNADEAKVTHEIDRVEMARATLNKTRTLMLLHMRQLLTADQRTKLTAMRDRGRTQQDQPLKPDTRKDQE